MGDEMMRRPVNVGFSGGEKKRNEIFHMAVLEPKLAILDETDSGLDIDALKIVSQGVNLASTDENAVLLVTHYQRILDYVKPDVVHVFMDGRIVRSGGPDLARELEERGYDVLTTREPGGTPIGDRVRAILLDPASPDILVGLDHPRPGPMVHRHLKISGRSLR